MIKRKMLLSAAASALFLAPIALADHAPEPCHPGCEIVRKKVQIDVPARYRIIEKKIWVPARFELVSKQVRIPARYEMVDVKVFVPAQYRIVEHTIQIPARYRIVEKKIWVPARYITRRIPIKDACGQITGYRTVRMKVPGTGRFRIVRRKELVPGTGCERIIKRRVRVPGTGCHKIVKRRRLVPGTGCMVTRKVRVKVPGTGCFRIVKRKVLVPGTGCKRTVIRFVKVCHARTFIKAEGCAPIQCNSAQGRKDARRLAAQVAQYQLFMKVFRMSLGGQPISAQLSGNRAASMRLRRLVQNARQLSARADNGRMRVVLGISLAELRAALRG